MNNNQVEQRKANPVSVMTTFLSSNAVKNKVNAIIGAKEGDKAISNLISNVQQNPKLAECTQGSLVNGMLAGHALHLDFALQQAYLVPFKNNKTGDIVAQFCIGWKGYVQMALRSAAYNRINVSELKEGELKKFDRLTEEYEIEWIEDDFERDKKPTTHYIAFIELVNGFKKVLVWTREKVELHARKYSASYQGDLKYNSKKSFWTTDFDAQAKKTLLRQIISKFGVMSIEMQEAFKQDMSTIDEQGNPVYVDNPIENSFNVEAEVVDDNPTINDEQIEILAQTIVRKGLNVVEYLNSKGFNDVAQIKINDYKSMIKELSE